MFQVVLLAICVAVVLGDVLHLTESEFAQHVDGSTNLLVEFYAPWCGHCKNLAPEWKLAGETFQAADDIKIIAIDATEAPKLSKDYKIQGYPTIKFFPKGSVEPEDYNGGRTADDIVKWVNKKIGTSRKLKSIPSSVTTLTSDNFDKVVMDPSKNVLVEFYAPWCGHCKALAPKYEDLAKIFAGEKNVVIAKVDATEDGALADKYGVTGYPTLKFFGAGNKEPQSFDEAREVENMVNFINANAGTQRNADGTLFPQAGRVSVLDEILSSSAEYTVDVVTALQKAASGLSGADKSYAKQYLAIVDKILAKGMEYVTKENSRLSNMIASPSVAPESKTGFMIKKNILAAFAQ